MKFPHISGIYCIENIANGKKYIGQAWDINKRIREHKYELRTNIHTNNHLQCSYNKYGKENFIFYIMECCNKESLNEKEEFWIDKLNLINNSFGYNKNAGGNSTFIISYETREKLRIINTGKKCSEETKQKLREANLGKVSSLETRQKMSDSKKGDKHPNFGKKASPELKEKFRLAHLGKPNPNKGKKYKKRGDI